MAQREQKRKEVKKREEEEEMKKVLGAVAVLLGLKDGKVSNFLRCIVSCTYEE